MKLLKIAIVLLSGGALAFYLYFQAALFQEPDTAEVAKAAISMEWNRTDSALIHSNPNRLIIRAGSLGLNRYLGQQGWIQADQLGAHLVYRKGNQQLSADCGMFSRRYAICKIDPRPYVKKP